MPKQRPTLHAQLRLAPLAMLAAASLPAQAVVGTQAHADRLTLQARVAAVRAALAAAPVALHPPAAVPTTAEQLQAAQATNWTNWPKWSKWSNWANK